MSFSKEENLWRLDMTGIRLNRFNLWKDFSESQTKQFDVYQKNKVLLQLRGCQLTNNRCNLANNRWPVGKTNLEKSHGPTNTLIQLLALMHVWYTYMKRKYHGCLLRNAQLYLWVWLTTECINQDLRSKTTALTLSSALRSLRWYNVCLRCYVFFNYLLLLRPYSQMNPVYTR